MSDDLRQAAEKEVEEQIDQYADQLNTDLAKHFGVDKIPAEQLNGSTSDQ